VQAEVLFWLGEGEHSLRNYDAALDYYLRLHINMRTSPCGPPWPCIDRLMIYEIKGITKPPETVAFRHRHG
jgi:hypothetical protein